MTRVVVDTSIVFRAFLSRDSPIWRHLRADQETEFHAPTYLRHEIDRHWDRVRRLTKMEEGDLDEARGELLSRMTLVDIEDISTDDRERAFDLCRDVDLDDTPFVALALHLQASLWTGDEALKKGILPKGFTTFYEPQI